MALNPSSNGSNHSYEEIRRAAYQVLRDTRGNAGDSYGELKGSIAHYLDRLEGTTQTRTFGHHDPNLSPYDANIYLEVFWALFREGIITLGFNDSNPNFPWYRVTEYGRKILANQDPYFFTDVSDYEPLVKASVPNIDTVTMLYVKEAVQTFKIGSLLASSVMIGVASEHTFNLLVETVEANATWSHKFLKVSKETRILPRLNEFKKVVDANISSLTPAIKEDLDTRFMGIISLIRTFRNDAGHPTGKILDRQQAYVNLQLFIPYARKLYQLKDFFS